MAAGGYLAVIESNAENVFVGGLASRPWLGGCDGDVEGTWEWVNGAAWSYTAWSAGEPNNMSNEDCAELAYGGTAWNDIWCDYNSYGQGYVCEFEM